jgi:hypothetical protein
MKRPIDELRDAIGIMALNTRKWPNLPGEIVRRIRGERRELLQQLRSSDMKDGRDEDVLLAISCGPLDRRNFTAQDHLDEELRNVGDVLRRR